VGGFGKRLSAAFWWYRWLSSFHVPVFRLAGELGPRSQITSESASRYDGADPCLQIGLGADERSEEVVHEDT